MPSFFRRLSFPRPRKTPSTADEQPVVVIEEQHQQTQPEEQLPLPTPETQRVLLLHAPRQPYQLTDNYAVPKVQGEHEVLVRTQAIGLNPIDWKAPDFNFAIPELPYISGRELAGEVVQKPNPSSRLKARDRVWTQALLYSPITRQLTERYRCWSSQQTTGISGKPHTKNMSSPSTTTPSDSHPVSPPKRVPHSV